MRVWLGRMLFIGSVIVLTVVVTLIIEDGQRAAGPAALIMIALGVVGGMAAIFVLPSGTFRPGAEERIRAEQVACEVRLRTAEDRVKKVLIEVSRAILDAISDTSQFDTSMAEHQENFEKIFRIDDLDGLKRAIFDEIQKIKASNAELRGSLDRRQHFIRKQQNQIMLLEELSTHDPLTRTFNRYAFDRELKRQIKRSDRSGEKLSLMMMDLDYFKSINDQYGHPAGDRVLAGVGQLMQEIIREHDFLARYGGEEFAAILPDTGVRNAFLSAERLRTSLENVILNYQDEKIRVTGSFGVAERRENEKGEALLKRADRALYRAKQEGRNRTVTDDDYAGDR